MENLRYMLWEYSPGQPIYLGMRFKYYIESGFASGGAGYVLSREALIRFSRRRKVLKQDTTECKQKIGGVSVFLFI